MSAIPKNNLDIKCHNTNLLTISSSASVLFPPSIPIRNQQINSSNEIVPLFEWSGMDKPSFNSLFVIKTPFAKAISANSKRVNLKKVII